MTNYELALTRDQQISLIIVQFLKDPELVRLFLNIFRQVEFKSQQDFHCSLRKKTGDQWSRLDELCKSKHFYKMDPAIPITCNLPFDGERWRNSKDLMRHINYMYPGFIVLEYDLYGNNQLDYLITYPLEDFVVNVRKGQDITKKEELENLLYLRYKIETINQVYKSFGSSGPIKGTINQAYRDFRDMVEDYTDESDFRLPRLVKNLSTGMYLIEEYEDLNEGDEEDEEHAADEVN